MTLLPGRRHICRYFSLGISGCCLKLNNSEAQALGDRHDGGTVKERHLALESSTAVLWANDYSTMASSPVCRLAVQANRRYVAFVREC